MQRITHILMSASALCLVACSSTQGSVTQDPPPAAGQGAPPQAALPEPEAAGTTFAMATIAEHNSKESCYTAVDGLVYDITPYIPHHPGDEKNIMKICGRDGSSMFGRKHGENEKAKAQLASMQIGTLAN